MIIACILKWRTHCFDEIQYPKQMLCHVSYDVALSFVDDALSFYLISFLILSLLSYALTINVGISKDDALCLNF